MLKHLLTIKMLPKAQLTEILGGIGQPPARHGPISTVDGGSLALRHQIRRLKATVGAAQ